MSRFRMIGIVGAVVSAAALGACLGGHEVPDPEQALLRRQVSGLRALVDAAEKGRLVPFDQMLVVVDESLVKNLLSSTTPYERIVGGRFRVRVESALVQFSHGFAFVRLDGQASFVDQDVSAELKVYSGLDVVEIDPASGTLRARANVFAVEVPRLELMGSERRSWRLAEELSKEQLDSYGALLVPRGARAHRAADPDPGCADATRDHRRRPASHPGHRQPRPGIRGQALDLRAGRARPRANADAGAGRADGAAMKRPSRRTLLVAGAATLVLVGAAALLATRLRNSRTRAASHAELAQLRLLDSELHARLEMLARRDPLVKEALEMEGDVILAVRSSFLAEVLKETSRRYFDTVVLDLADVRAHADGVVHKDTFIGNIKAGEWNIEVSIGEMRGVLKASAPSLRIASDNVVTVGIPVSLQETTGTARLHFAWDSKALVNVVCRDFEIDQELVGRALSDRYSIEGAFVLSVEPGTLFESIEVPAGPASKFRVRFRVREDLHPLVRTDSVASIQTEGIVGGTFLFVNAGSDAAPPVPDEGTIPGREPFEMADLMQQMSETIRTVNDTINALRGDIEAAVGDVADTARKANDLITDISDDVAAISESSRRIMADTQGIIAGLQQGQGTIGRLIKDNEIDQRVVDTARQTQGVVEEARKAVQQGREALEALQSKDGPTQGIAADLRETLEHARSTLANMEENTQALKRNFFFRGFFKDRGYYDLDALSPAEYRRGALGRRAAAGTARAGSAAAAGRTRGRAQLAGHERHLDADVARWQNAIVVWPQRTRSPSCSRRWPSRRISLTKVPFCDQPSSSTVHSPARNSNCACRRETSRSHGSAMSASKRRPTVSVRVVSSSSRMCSLPLSSR